MRWLYKLLRIIKRTDAIIKVEDKDPSWWSNNKWKAIQFARVVLTLVGISLVILY